MDKNFKIKMPFFEIGPKVFLYGEQAVDLAIFADSMVEKYGVDIIFTAQYTDIDSIVRKTKHLHVFAQHMDPVVIGRGIGAVLPEAIKAAGARGVMLNHTERPLTISVLNKTIKRADEVGLATVVCADTIEEAKAIAQLRPNIILAEAPDLIEGGVRTEKDSDLLVQINKSIWQIDPEIVVMHSAGIHNEKDVFNIILSGAVGTGSTSGIIKAPDMYDMTERMIKAVREAYDMAHSGRVPSSGKSGS